MDDSSQKFHNSSVKSGDFAQMSDSANSFLTSQLEYFSLFELVVEKWPVSNLWKIAFHKHFGEFQLRGNKPVKL